MLELRDLEVRYGSVPAVSGLSLEVRRGEIVGLVGPNGAGKSTALLAVMGVLKPAGGEILLSGRSLTGLPPEQIVRAGISLVPEGRHVFAQLTVEENLRLGLAGRRDADGAGGDLDWVGELFPVVAEARRRAAGLLSGGQQQQLAIARALLARPDVLLLDEPTLGLAPTVVEVVLEALAKIRDSGVTVLLVEQRAQLAVGFADRSYVMSGGRVRLELGPEHARDTERLVAAYFGA